MTWSNRHPNWRGFSHQHHGDASDENGTGHVPGWCEQASREINESFDVDWPLPLRLALICSKVIIGVSPREVAKLVLSEARRVRSLGVRMWYRQV
jgi:hypothetical protein